MSSNGIFVVDKPIGMTTNTLIQKIKRKLNLKKVGHAGTLDPLASGVVLVLVNNGTKFSDLLLNQTKIYEAEAKLYVRTDSYDVDGKILEIDHTTKVTYDQLSKVVSKYNGYTYLQKPPIYSAIKINGKKLYEYARNDQDVDFSSREVIIKTLNLLDFNEKEETFKLYVQASKGTYIRSLIVDLAQELETFAHITKLRRVASGVFGLNEAKTLEELTMNDLISNYEVVEKNGYQIYELSKEEYNEVRNGKSLKLAIPSSQVFLSYEKNIVAFYQEDNGWYRSIKGGFDV